MRAIVLTSLVASSIISVACRPIDVTPVTTVLDASVALALAGSIAMTAVAGEGPDCVTITPACAGAPCVGRVEVAVGETCPLALGTAAGGTVILDGQWTDANTGTFTPDLTSMIGVRDGAVSLTLGAAVVTRDDDDVTVAFGSQEVAAGGDGDAGVNQEGWVVTVHLQGTPADPADDVVEMSGAGQSTAAASGEQDEAAVRQLVLALTKTDPACRTNPVEGNATVSEAGNTDGEETSLLFHTDCDGGADVLVSSADPTRIGSSISLGY